MNRRDFLLGAVALAAVPAAAVPAVAALPEPARLGKARVEHSDGQIRVYDRNGVLKVRMGRL